MSDVSNLLSTEQKAKLLQDRLTQFASEMYQYQLNKKTAEATGMQEHADAAEKAIVILTKAIEIHKAELDSLPSSES